MNISLAVSLYLPQRYEIPTASFFKRIFVSQFTVAALLIILFDVVILSEAKNLMISGTLKPEILRFAQNDIKNSNKPLPIYFSLISLYDYGSKYKRI